MRHHIIVAMVGAVPARVECLSCHKQHNYKAAPPGTKAAKAPKAGGATTTRSKAKAAPDAAPGAAGEHPLDALLAVRAEGEARDYRPAERYSIGDLIRHPSFGLGAVAAAPMPGKIEVIFRDQSRLLLHERDGAPAGPKLQPPPRRDDRPMGPSDAPPPQAHKR